jgi:hypothetical protein
MARWFDRQHRRQKTNRFHNVHNRLIEYIVITLSTPPGAEHPWPVFFPVDFKNRLAGDTMHKYRTKCGGAGSWWMPLVFHPQTFSITCIHWNTNFLGLICWSLKKSEAYSGGSLIHCLIKRTVTQTFPWGVSAGTLETRRGKCGACQYPGCRPTNL